MTRRVFIHGYSGPGASVTHYTESLGKNEYAEYGSFEVLSDEGAVYVVAVNYDTGNTFGRSNSHCTIVEVFSDCQKAQDLAQRIANDPKKSFDYENDLGKIVRLETYSWTGYFEDFNHVDVITLGRNKMRFYR